MSEWHVGCPFSSPSTPVSNGTMLSSVPKSLRLAPRTGVFLFHVTSHLLTGVVAGVIPSVSRRFSLTPVAADVANSNLQRPWLERQGLARLTMFSHSNVGNRLQSSRRAPSWPVFLITCMVTEGLGSPQHPQSSAMPSCRSPVPVGLCLRAQWFASLLCELSSRPL
jgi:hypothetical protein